MRIGGRGVWVLDNSHDVVVAQMAEAAEDLGGIDAATIERWKVWASVPDLAFSHDGPVPTVVSDVLTGARKRIVRHGDVHPEDLRNWYLLDDIAVTGGLLRYESLPVDALLDVLDGFTDLFAETLAPDPPGSWWFLGVPGGRRTLAMRDDRS